MQAKLQSCNNTIYYTSVSVFLYKNMTLVLLLHTNINCMTIPPCGNFSNHISRTFLNYSSHWFKLNDVMQVLRLFHCTSQITAPTEGSKFASLADNDILVVSSELPLRNNAVYKSVNTIRYHFMKY